MKTGIGLIYENEAKPDIFVAEMSSAVFRRCFFASPQVKKEMLLPKVAPYAAGSVQEVTWFSLDKQNISQIAKEKGVISLRNKLEDLYNP